MKKKCIVCQKKAGRQLDIDGIEIFACKGCAKGLTSVFKDISVKLSEVIAWCVKRGLELNLKKDPVKMARKDPSQILVCIHNQEHPHQTYCSGRGKNGRCEHGFGGLHVLNCSGPGMRHICPGRWCGQCGKGYKGLRKKAVEYQAKMKALNKRCKHGYETPHNYQHPGDRPHDSRSCPGPAPKKSNGN